MDHIYKGIGKILCGMVEEDLIPLSNIRVCRRPKFFGQYIYSIKFQPNLSSFLYYNERFSIIKRRLDAVKDIRVVSNKITRFIYVYGNSSETLQTVLESVNDFVIAEINLIRADCTGLKNIPREPLDLFFGQYTHRIAIDGDYPNHNPEVMKQLAEQIPNSKVLARLKPYHSSKIVDAYNHFAYIYLENEQDVITAMLILSCDILEMQIK